MERFGWSMLEPLCNWEEPIKIGPWGRQGGTAWSYKPNGGIIEIIVAHSAVVDSLSFKSVDENGEIQCSENFGGSGGVISKILLDWPREYLISISGTYDEFYATQSLCFHTNCTKYGPFGSTDGIPFSFPIEGGVIVGFHGSVGISSIEALGLHLMRSAELFGTSSQIFELALDWPQEFLTSITGTRCTYNNFYVIRSLCFHTNRIKYGPFGCSEGSLFAFNIEDGVIVGFHGRASIYINALGYYIKHSADLFSSSNQIQTAAPKEECCNRKPIKIGPWGNLGGTHWSYKTNGGITEIIIGHAAIDNSLSFKSVDNNGKTES